jgi:hypothetical protein
MWLIDDARNFDQCLQFFKDAETVGMIGLFSLKKVTTTLSIYYAVYDSNELVAYYWLMRWDKLPNTYKSHEVHVKDGYQKRGIGLSLYLHVLFVEKYIILSDHLHTQISSKMWNKLYNIPEVEVGTYNEITDLIDWHTFNKEYVYGNDYLHFIARAR